MRGPCDPTPGAIEAAAILLAPSLGSLSVVVVGMLRAVAVEGTADSSEESAVASLAVAAEGTAAPLVSTPCAATATAVAVTLAGADAGVASASAAAVGVVTAAVVDAAAAGEVDA